MGTSEYSTLPTHSNVSTTLVLRCRFVVGYRSRYGAFLTFAWSPDMKYIVTGGEDDYIYLWSFLDGKSDPFDNQQRQELARGKAHRSWVLL